MRCPLIVRQWLCAWNNSDTHCLLTVEYTEESFKTFPACLQILAFHDKETLRTLNYSLSNEVILKQFIF